MGETPWCCYLLLPAFVGTGLLSTYQAPDIPGAGAFPEVFLHPGPTATEVIAVFLNTAL
jgi:hypothetical protein